VRFKGLAALKRPEGYEVTLAGLPEQIPMARYALSKAFKIGDLVRTVYQESYEWYGFTIATRGNPELIMDIGLPKNDQNLSDYTSVGPEKIAGFQEALPQDQVINGWIHSHGSLPYEQFSRTDVRNQVTVLDYVTALLRKPVAKKEILIRDLTILVKERWTEKDLERGSVTLITDAPITEARVIETIFGGFCYAIVIGDGGWHRQEIHYKRRGVLSGQVVEERQEADLVLVQTGRQLTGTDVQNLEDEVREKIQPGTPLLRERFEKEAT
jgi:hypothetical protein